MCIGCGKQLVPGEEGCSVTDTVLNGRELTRIRLGSESAEWWLGRAPETRCHDCVVRTGQFHHVGCDMEECPACGGQMLSCDCVAVTP